MELIGQNLDLIQSWEDIPGWSGGCWCESHGVVSRWVVMVFSACVVCITRSVVGPTFTNVW